jgi:dimethylargininase
VTGPFAKHPEFESFDKIVVQKVNCLWINGRVLVIEGIPETKEKIEDLGYPVIEVPFSEYLKLDGGLGCLSLRW